MFKNNLGVHLLNFLKITSKISLLKYKYNFASRILDYFEIILTIFIFSFSLVHMTRKCSECMVNYTSSDTEAKSGNRYGASGSCAGMSDEEVMKIKAPPI